MNKWIVAIIVLLALLAMAPGTPGTPPAKPTQPPPPPPTEPPPPVVTEPPATEPPIILTEPPVMPTEPVVFTEVAPRSQPTQWKPDPDKFKNASLPKSGYGPQAEPAQVDLVCGGMALLLMVVAAFVVLR